ncbi:kynurenine formamidase-like [Tribolium madens]|uniref:kynurenine formamidase-like n=1 Tax=Tribolium madens TaxID=41895 RepID=UPI001CF71EFA|nr:kynurenine formamidase-like [Tribolium madens]
MTDFEKSTEKLFLPNQWSKRFSPDVIVNKHLEFATKGSETARQEIPSQLNVKYGELEKEKIDIFGTDLSNDAPILVFVHGGYWQKEYLNRATYHFLAPILHKNGIKSMFIGYELCPKVTLSQIINEVVVATKKCLNYAKENGSKGFYLAGYSAGAHVVATLYTNLALNLSNEDRNMIKSVFLIAGIYDLRELPKTCVNEPLNLSQDQAKELSPLLQNLVSGVTTKFYVISAKNDSPEFQKQAKMFNEKLQNGGLVTKWINVENVDHFDVVERVVDEGFEVTNLILEEIKNLSR